jgi:hypothetical protein
MITPLTAMGAAREHGITDALREAGVKVIVDYGYRGSGFVTPQRRRPADPETARVRTSRGNRRRLFVAGHQPWLKYQRRRRSIQSGGVSVAAT